MSDEFRDLLKHRADEVQVPASNLDDVIRGGNARKWRNRAYSVGVVVLVVVVGWATLPGIVGSLRDDDSPRIANTPTPTPEETRRPDLVPGQCETVPFRPTYLPDEWSYELQPSDMQNSLGHYTTIEKNGGSVDVFLYDGYYRINPGEGDPIEVLGDDAQSGTIHEGGLVVEFTYRDCSYSLSTYTESLKDLRRIASGLRPLDSCVPPRLAGPDIPIEDGKHFGYIEGITETAVQFDSATFLTGDKANDAAIAAGAIDEGDTVPNDYFIQNEDESSGALGLSNDPRVVIDTIQDGLPGPAPADLAWLICEFSGERPDDRVTHRDNGYWLTVKDGVVTEIEEQYVP
jgi:hypothetical protein